MALGGRDRPSGAGPGPPGVLAAGLVSRRSLVGRDGLGGLPAASLISPSGVELPEHSFGLGRLVSPSASEQGFRAGDMLARTAP